jgi:hypothetical protein
VRWVDELEVPILRGREVVGVAQDDEPPIGTRREGGGVGPVDRLHGGSPYGSSSASNASSTRAIPRWTTCERRSSRPRRIAGMLTALDLCSWISMHGRATTSRGPVVFDG